MCFFFFQAEDGIRDYKVTGVQTCALPILEPGHSLQLEEGRCGPGLREVGHLQGVCAVGCAGARLACRAYRNAPVHLRQCRVPEGGGLCRSREAGHRQREPDRCDRAQVALCRRAVRRDSRVPGHWHCRGPADERRAVGQGHGGAGAQYLADAGRSRDEEKRLLQMRADRTPERAASARRLLPRALMAPAVAVLLCWMLVPLLMTIYFSLVNYNLMQPGEHRFAGWDNYAFFITAPDFLPAVWNTLNFLASVVLITLVLGVLIALLINEPFPGRGVVRVLLISPFFVMPTVNALLWKHMMMNPIYGVLASLWRAVGDRKSVV